MTDQAQILAIAVACGYPKQEKRWLVPVGHGVCETAMQGFKSREEAVAWTVAVSVMNPGEPQEYLETIPAPDYLTSLEAMHEAESVLTPEQLNVHVGNLAKAILRSPDKSVMGQQMWRATARQRAEAFLRTLGLWVEAA